MDSADRRAEEPPPPETQAAEPPPSEPEPPVPPPTSWEQKQKDIGGALFIGALTLIVLLSLLVWKGLF